MEISYWISLAATAILLLIFMGYVRKVKLTLAPGDELINDQKPIAELYPELMGVNI